MKSRYRDNYLFSAVISLMFEQAEYSVEETDGLLSNTVNVTKGGVETEQELVVLVQRSSSTALTAGKGNNLIRVSCSFICLSKH